MIITNGENTGAFYPNVVYKCVLCITREFVLPGGVSLVQFVIPRLVYL